MLQSIPEKQKFVRRSRWYLLFMGNLKSWKWLAASIVAALCAMLVTTVALFLKTHWGTAVLVVGCVTFVITLINNPEYWHRRLASSIVSVWLLSCAVSGFDFSSGLGPATLRYTVANNIGIGFHATVAIVVLTLLVLDYLKTNRIVYGTVELARNAVDNANEQSDIVKIIDSVPSGHRARLVLQILQQRSQFFSIDTDDLTKAQRVEIATKQLDTQEKRLLANNRNWLILGVVMTLCCFALASIIVFNTGGKTGTSERIEELKDALSSLHSEMENRDYEQRELVAGVRDAVEVAQSSNNAAAVAKQLRKLLGELDSYVEIETLAPLEKFDVRMAKAALANSEERYEDALNAIQEYDERWLSNNGDSKETERQLNVLTVRSMAFFGLGEWRAALNLYLQILEIRPRSDQIKSFAADCYGKLYRFGDAYRLYNELIDDLEDSRTSDELGMLASTYFKRATLPTLGQTKQDFNLAIAKTRELVGLELDPEKIQIHQRTLASRISSRGVNFLFNGEIENAKKDAIESVGIIRNLLEAKDNYVSKRLLKSSLARSLQLLGGTNVEAGLDSVALTNFSESINIHEELIASETDRDMILLLQYDASGCYRLRGASYLKKRQLKKANRDFNNAATVMERLVVSDGREELTYVWGGDLFNRGTSYWEMGELEKGLTDFEKIIDIHRKRFENGGGMELARGFIMNLQITEDSEKTKTTVAKAIRMYQKKMAESMLASALNHASWHYATCYDGSLRNPKKALSYAKEACERTNFSDPTMLDTFAAAYASADEFESAIKLQKKAISLAPATLLPELKERLMLYDTGQQFIEKPALLYPKR